MTRLLQNVSSQLSNWRRLDASLLFKQTLNIIFPNRNNLNFDLYLSKQIKNPDKSLNLNLNFIYQKNYKFEFPPKFYIVGACNMKKNMKQGS